jgi:hypothetical protein
VSSLAKRLGSDRVGPVWTLAAGFGLLGAFELLLLTRNGPGLSPDSASYLSAADSLASTATFQGFTPGDQFAVFAPLYSLLLAPGEMLGAPLTDARFMGAIVFGLVVAVGVTGAALIANSLVRAAGAGVAMLLSIALLQDNAFVWSDGSFALLCALFLLAASNVGNRPYAVALSGVLADAGTLTRYIGVTTIPVGLLAIALWSRKPRRDVLAFLGLASVGPALWVTRNLVVTSTLAGHRHSAEESLWVAIRDSTRTIGTWVQPTHPAVALVLAGVLTLPALRRLRRDRPQPLETVAVFFCVFYVAWLVLSDASVALDPIDDRFLAAMYAPMVWLAVGATGRLASTAVPWVGRIVTAGAILALLGTWAVFQARRIPDLSDYVKLSALPNLPRWTTEDEVRARRVSTHLLSNAPDAIYLRSGTRVGYAPRRAAYRSADPFDELTPLRTRLAKTGPAALIWFRTVKRPAVYTPPELANSFEVRLVGRTSFAAIYRLSCPCKASASTRSVTP